MFDLLFDLNTIIAVIIIAIIALLPAWISYKLSETKSFEKSWLISFAVLYVLYQIGQILHS